MNSDLPMTEAFYKHLYHFIRTRITEPHDAEDILHDVLYKAQQNIHTIKDQTKLTSWLFQIVRRTIIDFYRKKDRSVELDDAILDTNQEAPSNENEAIGSCLKDLITQLPEKYRSALEFTELHGMSQVELSKQLGISSSGAKSRVQRGRQQLQSLLIQCCTIDTDTYGNVVEYQKKDPCSTTCGCS